MDSQTITIVAGIVVLLIVVLAVWAYSRQSRAKLKERFGPEYDRTVAAAGTPAKAEAILRDRANRVNRFKLHKLTPDQAELFGRQWRMVQARFVDDPDDAVREADILVAQVMAARGYPTEDFEKRADDLSVDHPHVVENYRTARVFAARRERGEAGTEELRQAVVNYRALFDDLLEVDRGRRRAS